MVLLKLFLIAAAASAFRLGARPLTAINTQCQAYSCPVANFSWPSNNTCVLFNTINFVRPCSQPDLTYCNTTSGLCQPAPANNVTVQSAWPGEPCNATVPCQYGTCNNTVCHGVVTGGSCTIHDQCEPGLYCSSSNKCTPQILSGTSGCRSDFECANNAICNMTYSSTNGTCYTVGNLGLGKVVSDCSGGFSHLCQSGACASVDPLLKYGICSQAPLTVGKVPQNCTSDTDCVGSDGVNYFLSTCQCGFNSAGGAFCQPLLGDPPGVQMISTWRNALAASRVCNTVRRAAVGCLKATKTYQSVFNAVYYFQKYAQLQQNDDCIKRVYFNDYWLLSNTAVLVVLSSLVIAF